MFELTEKTVKAIAKAVAEVVVSVITAIFDGRRRRKARESAEKDVKKACEKGSLSDLIGSVQALKRAKKCAAAAICLMAAGCCSGPNIIAVRPYEGSYKTKADLLKAVQAADIPKGEQVWLLSPQTLNSLITK